MGLPHCRRDPVAPFEIEGAELAVAITVAMKAPVFLPPRARPIKGAPGNASEQTRWVGQVMATWRRAIELSLGDVREVEIDSVIASEVSEPGRACANIAGWEDPSFFVGGSPACRSLRCALPATVPTIPLPTPFRSNKSSIWARIMPDAYGTRDATNRYRARSECFIPFGTEAKARDHFASATACELESASAPAACSGLKQMSSRSFEEAMKPLTNSPTCRGAGGASFFIPLQMQRRYHVNADRSRNRR
jgi:hypothetical protein